jgi:hypothetical protein
MRGDFALSEALSDDASTWWISAPGTTPKGRGFEWIELELGGRSRRVSAVGLRIPPMPFGPLSVRRFHVQWKSDADADNSWNALPEMVTLDREELQEFALWPPVHADRLRLVCTVNAGAADIEEGSRTRGLEHGADCIGLFQVLVR